MSEPQAHDAGCEQARGAGCECRCLGMMHQNNVLIAAVEPRGSAAAFRDEVDRLFGTPFASATVQPAPGQRVRRDDWDPYARTSSARWNAQVEKRVVDVALGDVLVAVHDVNAAAATRRTWLTLVELLTGRPGHWRSMSSQIASMRGSQDARSGYFWASMLAAASDALVIHGGIPDVAQINAAVSSRFGAVRNPRARSGIRVQAVKEMQDPVIVGFAASRIASALASVQLPLHEAHLILSVTGAAVSADLWRHPVAVRHLLLPAVALLRYRHARTFSLDGPGVLTEDVVQQELGDKWLARGAW